MKKKIYLFLLNGNYKKETLFHNVAIFQALIEPLSFYYYFFL